MIIISIVAALIAIFVILYGGKSAIKYLNERKIPVNEEEILIIEENNKNYSNELGVLKDKLKLVYKEKENNPNNIKILENIYEEKTENEKILLEKTYAIQLDKEAKLIKKELIKAIFEEDIKNIFKGYTSNVQGLEKDLEDFFKEK